MAALYGELHDWPSFAVDVIRELSIFAFTITSFESLKDFYLRRENEEQKRELLDDAVRETRKVLEEKNRLALYGIEDAMMPFDAAALQSIITDLTPGDCLYCHDGSIPNFEDVKDSITELALNNVKFRFMSVAPYCMNAKRRAQELRKDGDGYSSRCKGFGDDIEMIRSHIREKSRKRIESSLIKPGQEDNNPEAIKLREERIAAEVEACVDNVQIRYFRSLLSVPFYLLEKADGTNTEAAGTRGQPPSSSKLVRAWTGFYLRKGSSSFIFVQWKPQEAGRILRRNKQENTDMISNLKEYWDFKWKEGHEEYEGSALWVGKWRYECIDESAPKDVVYLGTCQVKEKSGQLDAVTTRTHTCINPESCESIFIRWTNEEDDGDAIHKYRRGKDNYLFLALSYRPEKQGNSKTRHSSEAAHDDAEGTTACIKSFVRLKAIDNNRLEGSYHIAFSDESLKRPDVFPSTNGKIRLYREGFASSAFTLAGQK